ncbi:MAG: hypothetical protein EB127_29730, partial [Alphaproteobacteria bacterium]|nr:hypothetical protein [Alphaproteobacteria bacterium]
PTAEDMMSEIIKLLSFVKQAIASIEKKKENYTFYYCSLACAAADARDRKGVTADIATEPEEKLSRIFNAIVRVPFSNITEQFSRYPDLELREKQAEYYKKLADMVKKLFNQEVPSAATMKDLWLIVVAFYDKFYPLAVNQFEAELRALATVLLPDIPADSDIKIIYDEFKKRFELRYLESINKVGNPTHVVNKLFAEILAENPQLVQGSITMRDLVPSRVRDKMLPEVQPRRDFVPIPLDEEITSSCKVSEQDLANFIISRISYNGQFVWDNPQRLQRFDFFKEIVWPFLRTFRQCKNSFVTEEDEKYLKNQTMLLRYIQNVLNSKAIVGRKLIEDQFGGLRPMKQEAARTLQSNALYEIYMTALMARSKKKEPMKSEEYHRLAAEKMY